MLLAEASAAAAGITTAPGVDQLTGVCLCVPRDAHANALGSWAAEGVVRVGEDQSGSRVPGNRKTTGCSGSGGCSTGAGSRKPP